MKDHFSKEILEPIVKKSKSKADVLRAIGLAPKGGNYAILTRWLDEHKIDYSHFTGASWSKGEFFTDRVCKIKLEDLLKENVDYHSDTLKKRLWQTGTKEQKCEICGIIDWNGKPLTFELHHINGNHYDNRLENLQILCPNCHSQTEGHKNRGKKHSGDKVPFTKVTTINCQFCGKEFHPQRKSTKFCSRECYNNFIKTSDLSKVKTTTPNLLDKETLQTLCDQFETLTDIANHLNVSRPTVKKYLERYELWDSFKHKFTFRAIKVGQYDTNGNLIKIWPSISDAENTLNICSISKCISGKRRSAGGYIWKSIDI